MTTMNTASLVLNKLLTILPIVLTVIGLVGNTLTCFILTRPKLLGESMFRYFIFYNAPFILYKFYLNSNINETLI